MWREKADIGAASDVVRECRFRDGQRCGERKQIEGRPAMWRENTDLGAASDVARAAALMAASIWRENADLGAAGDVASECRFGGGQRRGERMQI